jgi:hypothetical protein
MKWLVLLPLMLFVGAMMLIAVVGAVLWGAGLVFITTIHHLPWLFVLVGIWFVMRSGGGRHRRHAWAGGPGWGVPSPPPRPYAPPAPPRAGSSTTVADPPAPKAEEKKRELPIDLKVKVEQIRHKADVLQGYADRFPPFSHDLHLVRQTAADYLPRTVDAYLALPGTEEPIVGAEGKTALQELREQLALLDSKLDEIAGDLQREDVDHLLANRRFLEDRFKAGGVGPAP